MEVTIRPEAADLIGYAMGGLLFTVMAMIIVFVVAFVPCYVVSLIYRCVNIWVAFNRAWPVAKSAIWASVAVLATNAIIVSETILGVVAFCGLAAMCITLVHSLYTVPRTVRAFRQDQEEWELRKAGKWHPQDQQNSLAG